MKLRKMYAKEMTIMNEKFKEYLHSIDATDPIIVKVESVYNDYLKVCPDEITGIFVSEYVEDSGERIYENLWFFSERYCIESKNFTQGNNIDIAPLKKEVHRIFLDKKDYDLNNANVQSRMVLHFALSFGISGTIKASKENCDYLRDIIKKYIIPNLKD